MIELSYMFIQACEEAVEEGKQPESDPAVALIAGRIGFASPADTMSQDSWNQLIAVCEQGLTATVQLKSGARH